jgi:N6-adenosine-specific RNA methylase IME4
VEACSWGPRLEIFARGTREGWRTWGDQADDYKIGWDTYAHNSQAGGDHWIAEAAE